MPGRLETCGYYPVFSPKQTRDGLDRGLSAPVLPFPLHMLWGKHIFELEPGTLFSTELVKRMERLLEASRVFGTLELVWPVRLEGFVNGVFHGTWFHSRACWLVGWFVDDLTALYVCLFVYAQILCPLYLSGYLCPFHCGSSLLDSSLSSINHCMYLPHISVFAMLLKCFYVNPKMMLDQ